VSVADRVLVLIVASGSAWEPAAVRRLGEHPRVVVLKRCVDVDDLLAAATAGQAHVAVVGLDAPGLDRPAVEHLHRHAVRPVAVATGAAPRTTSLGISQVVGQDDLDGLVEAVLDAVRDEGPAPTVVAPAAEPAPEPPGAPGRVVTVWGPAGAPGRTTVATAVAAELGRRRRRTVLVDADPYGGSVAQQLGVLDEVSGLLAAARLAAGGQLAERVDTVQRAIDPSLSIVTGLPRADRWVEVRPGVVDHLLEVLAARAEVVVDTGFSLEDDGADLGARPGRNTMTLAALEAADKLVVVGAADPVGLSRLARGLVELREAVGPRPVHVVVNRMRATLGWSQREVAGMVTGFARLAGLHFLPDDQVAVDRALVSGRTLVEVGESTLGRSVAGLVDAVLPVGPGVLGGRRPQEEKSR
jgi:MinD-like ATPase involved in chromosome partitioning or flagellar assembly